MSFSILIKAFSKHQNTFQFKKKKKTRKGIRGNFFNKGWRVVEAYRKHHIDAEILKEFPVNQKTRKHAITVIIKYFTSSANK